MRQTGFDGRLRATWLAVLLFQATIAAFAYPLDGYRETGIRRLLAYQLIQDGKLAGNFKLQPGALLDQDSIRLRLEGVQDSFDIGPDTPVDPRLQQGLEEILGGRHLSYRVALVDITRPESPRYAAIRGDEGYIPGSVGKLLVMTGLFNELKKVFPNDIGARERVLRTTRVVADAFVVPNSHAVPIVGPDFSSVVHRAVRVGDTFSLWEWLDHMVSPSSNAAGSVVWKEALLLSVFGKTYPPTRRQEEAFLEETAGGELSDRSVRILEEPLAAAGLKTRDLRLRTYFTRGASRVIPGKSSYATPNQLVRWLIRLEQGKLVDSWSSLEMKKMMYFTRRRYRFAASPELNRSAVFFKSGSLYSCRPEPDYECGQYRGNARNLMHSVAIVESPSRVERQHRI